MLTDRRNTRATYRFLGKALTTMRHWPPSSITTDQLGSYPKAITRLQQEGKLALDTKHRTCKYLNNIIESNHGALKRVLQSMRGFQTMKTAAATTATRNGGRMLLREQAAIHLKTGQPGVRVTVADTGHGMEAHVKENLLDTFRSTKGINGSGLGPLDQQRNHRKALPLNSLSLFD